MMLPELHFNTLEYMATECKLGNCSIVSSLSIIISIQMVIESRLNSPFGSVWYLAQAGHVMFHDASRLSKNLS
jgi:hypothetical protein